MSPLHLVLEHLSFDEHTVRAFAEKLGEHKAAETLQKTLDEEGRLNRELTRLAERSINFLATKVAVS